LTRSLLLLKIRPTPGDVDVGDGDDDRKTSFFITAFLQLELVGGGADGGLLEAASRRCTVVLVIPSAAAAFVILLDDASCVPAVPTRQQPGDVVARRDQQQLQHLPLGVTSRPALTGTVDSSAEEASLAACVSTVIVGPFCLPVERMVCNITYAVIPW